MCKGNHTPTRSISLMPLGVRISKSVASKIYKGETKFDPGNVATYNSSLQVMKMYIFYRVLFAEFM